MTVISPTTMSALTETMLITLWAKAEEFARADALLKDAEAVRMKSLIDYDFRPFAKARATQAGCCARAALIDEEVLRFLARYPDAVAVQLGAGLDARFERLGRPALTAWYDVDLPEAIALRQMLLPESAARALPVSMFDEAWADTVAAHGKPVILIIEGVLMYFEEAQVRALFAMVARKLPYAAVVFDTLPTALVGKAKHHDALGRMEHASRPEFKWGLDDAHTLTQWQDGLHCLSQTGLHRRAGKRYPWLMRLMYATAWGRRRFDPQIVRLDIGTPPDAPHH